MELSTLGQPHIEPAWKQEVNRRLAAHRNRKGAEPAVQAPQEPHRLGSSRAAKAAARVAARYAQAPSYSQLQAEEARVAVRAAEIATQVALEAQAVAEDALAEMHAAAQEPPLRCTVVMESVDRGASPDASAVAEPRPAGGPAMKEEVSAMELLPAPEAASNSPETDVVAQGNGGPVAVRWEPDLPMRVRERRPVPREEFELDTEDWWTPAQVRETLRSEPIAVDPRPPQANLIEFPRELVATRRMRPRLVEAASREAAEAQLSIFEVDPGAISTEPVASPAVEPAAWTGPEWSGIELDEHPATATAPIPEPAEKARKIFLAPIGRRLMASVVDSSLILGLFFSAAVYLVSHMQHPIAGKPAEVLGVAALVLVGFLYHALFFAAGLSTPGMRYAGIAMSTFDDDSPTRAQMRRRLGAMALSLAPVGLGFAWSIFDEDHLTWHDRISQTYLRKR